MMNPANQEPVTQGNRQLEERCTTQHQGLRSPGNLNTQVSPLGQWKRAPPISIRFGSSFRSSKGTSHNPFYRSPCAGRSPGTQHPPGLCLHLIPIVKIVPIQFEYSTSQHGQDRVIVTQPPSTPRIGSPLELLIKPQIM